MAPTVAPEPERPVEPYPTSLLASQIEDGYTWRRLPSGAGGWVTGLAVSATSPQRRYARTDVGGAYRWDEADGVWSQLISTSSVPDWRERLAARANDYAVESLAVSAQNPDVLYVAVGSEDNPEPGVAVEGTGRVLRSDDAGRHWSVGPQHFFVGGNQQFRQRGERLAVDPADDRHVLYGTRRQGLWETFDSGSTWRRVPTDQVAVPEMSGVGDQPGVTFVTFSDIGDSVFVGVAGGRVYRRDGPNAAFSAITDALAPTVVPSEGSVVGGVLLVAFESVDGSAESSLQRFDVDAGTWSTITPRQGAAPWSVAIDPNDPQHIVAVEEAVRSGAVWVSTDGGAQWEPRDVRIDTPGIPWIGATDLAGYMPVGRLVFDRFSVGRLWFAEGTGVWRTDDLDAPTTTFVLDSAGIEELVTADLVAPAGVGPVSVVADRQGFRHVSLDAPPERTLVDGTFAGGTDIDYSGGSPTNLVWIGAEYHLPADRRRPRGARSSDGGATWQDLPNLTADFYGGNVAVSATDPDNIVWLPSYAINVWENLDRGKGVYSTADGGRTWRHLDSVGGSNRFHRLMWWLSRQALAADRVDGGVFYLFDDEQRFFVSTDGGVSFTQARNAPPCTVDNACHVLGQLRAAPSTPGEVWASTGNDGLWRTADRGASPWTKVSGLAGVTAFGFGAPLSAGGPAAVYAAGTSSAGDQGVFRSGDDGATWMRIATAPLGLYSGINSVSGDLSVPGRVYIGTGGTGFVRGDIE